MCNLDKLELEFEIATLIHNISEFKRMGYPTAEMQSRLDYCRAEFKALNLSSCNEN